MTRERAKELLPIIKAFAEGEEVEFQEPGSSKWWKPSGQHNADFEVQGRQSRIKPKPREWWLEFRTGVCLEVLHMPPIYQKPNCEYIHVRQVLK